MELNMLLYVSFVIYLIIMTTAFLFKIKWLYLVAGLLWFVPITQIDNLWIILISSIMILVHGVISFYEPKESEW